jgi:hypothetical protein
MYNIVYLVNKLGWEGGGGIELNDGCVCDWKWVGCVILCT